MTVLPRELTESVHHLVLEAYGEEAVVASPTLGCGNPTVLAALRPGEVVLDLGSGAGLDAMNAAPVLGDAGRFIGVDMTPAMLERARRNAVEAGHARTVEFREGLIEALPVASATVDVVISNCVVNLSPDKEAVFREMHRVLKPGGRVAISDLVLTAPLPGDVRALAAGRAACITGALTPDAYRQGLAAAGFTDVRVTVAPAACMLETVKDDPVMRGLIDAIGMPRAAALAAGVGTANVEARKEMGVP